MVKRDYSYKHPQVIMEFKECIGMLSKRNASDYIGVMPDETCYITVEKKLAVYIKFLENGKASVAFLGDKHTTNSTAAGIEIALIEFLTGKGISDEDISCVYGLGTDGALMMTRRLNGLGAKLKQRNSALVQVHCVAHTLKLTASQAAQGIDYCQQYHNMIHL